MKYDIFISYKRLTLSSTIAAYLYDCLTKKGYNVFFDRKEMKTGKFNEQLYNNIEGATDILILLEENSLNSCFSNLEYRYKSDWFCMEIMHALQLEGKNIIPIIIDGHQKLDPNKNSLPEEMKALAELQALDLTEPDMDSFYQDKLAGTPRYLQSIPKNLALQKQQQNNGAQIGSFLFYTNNSFCDLYEFGEVIAHLTDDNDEEHPFSCPVYYAGEHRFRIKNNNTCEEIQINRTIQQGFQEWVSIDWTEKRNIWKLSLDDIEDEDDEETLYTWGVNFFRGTATHEPDLRRAAACMEKVGIKKKHKASLKFLETAYLTLIDKQTDSVILTSWIKYSLEAGNNGTLYNLGYLYETGNSCINKNIEKALAYYNEGAECCEPRCLLRNAYIYLNGEFGIEVDEKKAMYYFEECAKEGNTEAQLKISQMLYDKYCNEVSVNNDFHTLDAHDKILKYALLWLHRAANGGSEEAKKVIEQITSGKEASSVEEKARTLLGEVYMELASSENKDSEKRAWLRSASELKRSDAMYQLGKMNPYLERKVKWYMDAAELDYVPAIQEIIHYYERNYSNEIKHSFYRKMLYHAAYDLNIKKAQYYLGQKYILGHKDLGILVDREEAFKLLTKAFTEDSNIQNNSKDSRALIGLTLCYMGGMGTNRSFIKAMKCFFMSIREHVLLRAIYELVEYLFESGANSMKRINKSLEKHNKLYAFIANIAERLIKPFKGLLAKRIGGEDNYEKMMSAITSIKENNKE